MQCQNINWLKALIKAAPLGLALMLWTAIQPLTAQAAEFSVYPTGMEFGPGSRASVIGINNKDQRPIRFQMTLVEWTQDAKGVDVYTPSDDLIYFPRQLTVKPGDHAIVRVGPKNIPKSTEKTYRLKVEELPEPMPESMSSAIGITITFAVPVFLGKLDLKPNASVAPLAMQDGKLVATVQNTGHSHFRIESLEVKGADGYTQKIDGWYLLAGASRQYTLDIPPDVCRAQKRLNLNVKVGESNFSSDLDIDPSMCGST